MRLKPPLFCIAMSLFWTACLASKAFAQDSSTTNSEHPKATIIRQPGAEYDNVHRVWQGMPEIEKTVQAKLWVTWISGGNDEHSIGTHVLAAFSNNGGKSWSKPILVIQGPEGTRISNAIMYTSYVGGLWIFYTQTTKDAEIKDSNKRAPDRIATYAIRTKDGENPNAIWSEPLLIAEGGSLVGKPRQFKSLFMGTFLLSGNGSENNSKLRLMRGSGEKTPWEWFGDIDAPRILWDYRESANISAGYSYMLIPKSKGLHISHFNYFP